MSCCGSPLRPCLRTSSRLGIDDVYEADDPDAAEAYLCRLIDEIHRQRAPLADQSPHRHSRITARGDALASQSRHRRGDSKDRTHSSRPPRADPAATAPTPTTSTMIYGVAGETRSGPAGV
jgi:hypothetical protein